MTNHPNRSKTNYAVHAQYNFYAGTLNVARNGVLLSPHDGAVIAFVEQADADALARMLNDTGNGPSVLSNGQYAPHEYTVVKSSAPAVELRTAMVHLGLQYDFRPDGERIEFVNPADA